MASRHLLAVALVLEVARPSGAAGQAAGQQLQPGSLVIVTHLSGAAEQGGFGAPAAGRRHASRALSCVLVCLLRARVATLTVGGLQPLRAVRRRDQQGLC